MDPYETFKIHWSLRIQTLPSEGFLTFDEEQRANQNYWIDTLPCWSDFRLLQVRAKSWKNPGGVLLDLFILGSEGVNSIQESIASNSFH